MQNKQASCQQGFTLIEAMIVVAIIAVVLAMAVPSFNDFFEKNRVKRAAEEVYGLVTKARADSVIHDSDMSLSVTTGANWCVGYAAAAGCDCTEADLDAAVACAVPVGNDLDGNPEMVLQVIDGTNFGGVGIANDFAGGTTFNGVKGTAGNGSVTLSSPSNRWKLSVAVTRVGRVRICAHEDSVATMGYTACQ